MLAFTQERLSAGRSVAGFSDSVVSDALFANDDMRLWAIADGVGPAVEARWAATTMIAAFAEAVESDEAQPELPFDHAIASGHRIISETSFRMRETLATAFAAIGVRNGRVVGAWVGNCRIYRLRNNHFERLTCDHSIAGQLAEKGEISQYEVSSHSLSKILTQAVGTSRAPSAAHFDCEAKAGDRFLLCSSGLARSLPDPLIALYLDRGPPKAAVDRLVSEAMMCGGRDSVAALVVDVLPEQ